jgi:hypothetical protein
LDATTAGSYRRTEKPTVIIPSDVTNIAAVNIPCHVLDAFGSPNPFFLLIVIKKSVKGDNVQIALAA